MKYVCFFILLIAGERMNSQPLIKNGEIDIRVTKFGEDLNCMGKLDNDFLFSTYNAKGPLKKSFSPVEPPELFLLNSNLATIKTADIKEQMDNAPEKKTTLTDLIVFNNKFFALVKVYYKEKKADAYYLYPINKNNLTIDFSKKIPVTEQNGWKTEDGYNNKAIWSISEDKTKLSITITSYNYYPYLKKNKPKHPVKLGRTIVFDQNMKVMMQNEYNVNDIDFEKEIYKQQVNNDGTVCLLVSYMTGDLQTSSYTRFITSIIYLIDNKGQGKEINFNLPKEIHIPSAVICGNENGFVVTGFSCIYDKNVLAAFGYFNFTFDNTGQKKGANIFPFKEYFDQYLKEKKYIYHDKNNILPCSTVLLKDGSFYMISQFYKNPVYGAINPDPAYEYRDIIVAYMDKEGKTIWLKMIDREVSTKIGNVNTYYQKSTNQLYLIYANSLSVKGMEYSVMNPSGFVKNNEILLTGDDSFYNGLQVSETEYIYNTVSERIHVGLVKF